MGPILKVKKGHHWAFTTKVKRFKLAPCVTLVELRATMFHHESLDVNYLENIQKNRINMY
jgi:hypothetical protein